MVPFVILSIDSPDDRAFMEQLYIKNHVMMYKTACKYIPPHGVEDADDIVGNACLSLISKIQLLKDLDENARKAYIYITVRNTAFSYLRSVSKNAANLTDNSIIESIPDLKKDPLEMMIEQNSNSALSQVIERLSVNDKSILEMKYSLGFQTDVIAKHFGISQDSVRMYLHRARLHLAEALELVKSKENNF